MKVTSEQVKAGQAVYSKLTLAVYDWFVLGFTNQLIWQCPSNNILKLYKSHISNNHLDIGVGTGYFLDNCNFSDNDPRIILFDLNPNSLEVTASRLQRYNPKTYQGNILEPINIEEEKFDSVGINYLFHCLPGNIRSKQVVLKNIKQLMNPEGVVFGSTVLSKGVPKNLLAKSLMFIYNNKGIFTNAQDDLDGLKEILAENFSKSCVEVIGCVALFWAKL